MRVRTEKRKYCTVFATCNPFIPLHSMAEQFHLLIRRWRTCACLEKQRTSPQGKPITFQQHKLSLVVKPVYLTSNVIFSTRPNFGRPATLVWADSSARFTPDQVKKDHFSILSSVGSHCKCFSGSAWPFLTPHPTSCAWKEQFMGQFRSL